MGEYKLVETYVLVESKGANCRGCAFYGNRAYNKTILVDHERDPCRFCDFHHVFKKKISLKEIELCTP